MTEQTEKIVQLLRTLYDTYLTVDPFFITEQLGIEVRYVNFLNNPLGQYLKIMNKSIILLSEKIENTNKRFFVLAHELHHALAHSDFGSYYSLNSKNRNKIEYEANAFAAAVCLNLYMEEHELDPMTKQDLENHYGLPMELSDIFL